MRVVAVHNNIRYARQHGVRSARLPRFGEMLPVEEKFGVLFRCARRVNYTRAAKQVLRSTILSSTILLVFFDNSRMGRF